VLTLLTLKAYLTHHKQASLTALSAHFQESPDWILYLAQHFITKGQIQCIEPNSHCTSGCQTQCSKAKQRFLTWIETV
jgi:hypothetical protein